MRFGRLLPALSVFVATGALIVLTGTGAAATQPGRSAPAATTANLAAPAALDSYLRSISVSRASLVVQRGARNYAGPNCPGKGWNCTTSTRVLQIAKADGQNKVDCPAGSIDPVTVPPSQSCTVTQTGPNNVAKCQQRSDSSAAVQYCKITQTGKKNVAHVHQTVHAEESDKQTATQTAVVKQNGGSNESNVHQEVKQKVNGDSSQSQDAQQSADVDQTATGAGRNASNVHQDQDLSAKGSAANQSQNTNDLGLADCAFGTGSPSDPNVCANVRQSSDAGKNDSHLKQSLNEDAKTHVRASQQQGSFLVDGGLDGQIHQDTDTGSSQNRVDQDKRQRLSAPPDSSQLQLDPVYCCGTDSQLGGTGNSEQIDQSSTQDASEDDAFQDIDLVGESVSPQGSCSVTQRARNNGADANRSASLPPPCDYLRFETGCSNVEGEAECPPSVTVLFPPDDECGEFGCGDFTEGLFAKLEG